MEHSELFSACKQNDLDRVRELLDHGADPNVQDFHGWTALMEASREGHADVVRLLLLDDRTDPNMKDNLGWAAWIHAIREGNTDVVKLLKAFSGWNRNITRPLEALGIFPEGLIREHLTV
jgi:ankyrin repeat protein